MLREASGGSLLRKNNSDGRNERELHRRSGCLIHQAPRLLGVCVLPLERMQNLPSQTSSLIFLHAFRGPISIWPKSRRSQHAEQPSQRLLNPQHVPVSVAITAGMKAPQSKLRWHHHIKARSRVFVLIERLSLPSLLATFVFNSAICISDRQSVSQPAL